MNWKLENVCGEFGSGGESGGKGDGSDAAICLSRS